MTYDEAHRQVKKARGPASRYTCGCGQPALDWALQHEGETVMDPAKGRLYSERVEDYKPMCRSCHTKLDREHDPEWAESSRESARRMGSRPRTFEEQSRLGKLGMAAAAPKLAGHRQAISELNRTARRRCLECGFESVRTGLGRHQQAKGHNGYEDV